MDVHNSSSDWLQMGLATVRALPNNRAQKFLLRELTHIDILLRFSIDVRKNNHDISGNLVLNSGMKVSSDARALIAKQGHIGGCDIDHTTEVQDAIKGLNEMPDDKALAQLKTAFDYQIVTREEHKHLTRARRIARINS